MKIKLFGNKKETTNDSSIEIIESPIDDADDSMDEMQQVARTISEIKRQNLLQAMLSGSKNERALAENDALISSVIKNILNWLAVITSAETVRKEEYDALTSQMLQLDEDVNAQLEMQAKFKKAYQTMIQKQDEQKELTIKVERLKKTNVFLLIVASVSLCISIVAILIALL